jgi:hypothetical protein
MACTDPFGVQLTTHHSTITKREPLPGATPEDHLVPVQRPKTLVDLNDIDIDYRHVLNGELCGRKIVDRLLSLGMGPIVFGL